MNPHASRSHYMANNSYPRVRLVPSLQSCHSNNEPRFHHQRTGGVSRQGFASPLNIQHHTAWVYPATRFCPHNDLRRTIPSRQMPRHCKPRRGKRQERQNASKYMGRRMERQGRISRCAHLAQQSGRDDSFLWFARARRH